MRCIGTDADAPAPFGAAVSAVISSSAVLPAIGAPAPALATLSAPVLLSLIPTTTLVSLVPARISTTIPVPACVSLFTPPAVIFVVLFALFFPSIPVAILTVRWRTAAILFATVLAFSVLLTGFRLPVIRTFSI